ncbi:MAG: hypothetical protein GTO45_29585 [Candidatus Aminicenantes bacterium]|nr:hypothetical protein [Candidatus Aminicenantes bacterium]NIM82946.1 hypothetical protein [Candidatus Aminicenantes bacterium]NIN22323.1 hypothetical protein [Candidatus Aminicenantes bacterium]NIN46091.1 hypothetical protein [Candidatus Aminicenantes bacterium]NIN88927.1 hypothetical protein [Candidatus Aminicenantes bacterium]
MEKINRSMKNMEKEIQEKSDKELKKIRDMYIEIIRKLFVKDSDGRQRSIYNRKIEKVGDKKFGLRSQNFVHAALEQLRTHFKELRLSPKGSRWIEYLIPIFSLTLLLISNSFYDTKMSG